LVFLDIQLSDGLGFEILRYFSPIVFKIIFTTAYSEYALQAIKFSAVDYLLKPIDSIELKDAVNKVKLRNDAVMRARFEALLHNQSHLNKRIALHTGEGISIYEVDSIIRCNSDGNYTHVYFNNGKKLLIVKSLKEFEELLAPYGFERIHHSHLINLKHLQSFKNKDGGYVVLSDKTTLPVSQRKRSAFIKNLERLNH